MKHFLFFSACCLLLTANCLLPAKARAQTNVSPLPTLNCNRVNEFIVYTKQSSTELKGSFIEKNNFGENAYNVLKTIIPGSPASWIENPPLVDEFGGTTTTVTYAEELYTVTGKTDADLKYQQYLQKLKNCGYTLWKLSLNETNRIEYSYIDYTETGNLYLYLGYELVNNINWIVYLDIRWTTYK